MKRIIAVVVLLCGYASIVQPTPARADDLTRPQRNQCTKMIVLAYTTATSKYELDAQLQDIPEACQDLFAHGAHLDQFQQEGCNEIDRAQMQSVNGPGLLFGRATPFPPPVACQELAIAQLKALSDAQAAQQARDHAARVAAVGGAQKDGKLVMLNNIQPRYPPQSIRQHHEGIVEVKVTVQPDGHVSDASIYKSCGFHELDNAALAAAQQWEFAPIPKVEDAIFPVTFDLNHL